MGRNSYSKTHPFQADISFRAGRPEKVYLHAEIAAIIKARGAEMHSIHVERYLKDGTPAMAKPCEVCDIAIQEAGIKKVSYTVG